MLYNAYLLVLGVGLVVGLEEAWLAYVESGRSRRPRWPRHVGEPAQRVVGGPEEYVEWLRGCAERGPCFTAKYSDAQVADRVVDKLVFDVDAPRITVDLVAEVKSFVEEVLNGDAVVLFSGSKGFHIYVYLPTDFPAMILEAAETVVRRLGYPQLLSDVETMKRFPGLIRTPWTVNEKSGRTAVVVDVVDRTPDRILDEALRLSRHSPRELAGQAYWPEAKPVTGFVNELLAAQAGYRLQRYTGVAAAPAGKPACIEYLEQKLRETGHLAHEERLLLVWYHVHAGTPKEEVVDLFRRYAEDYNEHITRYQVDYAYRKRYYPYKCKRIIEELRACPYALSGDDPRKCPFYPWMGRLLTR